MSSPMRSGTGNTAEFKEDNMSIHVVVMGVAGCGKSTVAEAIHERLGYVYAEGDDFHPQANIDKMRWLARRWTRTPWSPAPP